MSNGYLTFRSVTYAQRGESVLRKGGVRAALQRTPKWMEELGCGYCLRLDASQLRLAAALLRQGAVAFRKAYIRNGSGVTEEVTV